MIPSGHRRSSDIGDSAYVVMKPGFQNNIWIQQIFYLKKMKIYFIYDVVIAKAHATLGKFDTQLGNFQDVRVCLAHSLRWDAFIYVYLNWKKTPNMIIQNYIKELIVQAVAGFSLWAVWFHQSWSWFFPFPHLCRLWPHHQSLGCHQRCPHLVHLHPHSFPHESKQYADPWCPRSDQGPRASNDTRSSPK